MAREKRQKIETVQQIFDLAGGTMKLAIALNDSQANIQQWKHQGIPRKRWSNLIDLLGLTVEEIFQADELARR